MNDAEYDLRQMIILRRDLKMPKGKMIAQGAHASMSAALNNMDHEYVKRWLAGKFTKVAVWANTDEELDALMVEASLQDIPFSEIVDSGRTVFNGVPTRTCIAIGPAPLDILAPITGHLKLI